MAFAIEFTQAAADHVRGYRKFDQGIILDGIEEQLLHEPKKETRNRKSLGGHELAGWELRIEKFRVFYDVVEEGERPTVKVKAVGHKEHDKLLIGGKVVQL